MPSKILFDENGRTGDFDTSYAIGVRKYLRTHGLTPPAVESFETQSLRCRLSE